MTHITGMGTCHIRVGKNRGPGDPTFWNFIPFTIFYTCTRYVPLQVVLHDQSTFARHSVSHDVELVIISASVKREIAITS